MMYQPDMTSIKDINEKVVLVPVNNTVSAVATYRNNKRYVATYDCSWYNYPQVAKEDLYKLVWSGCIPEKHRWKLVNAADNRYKCTGPNCPLNLSFPGRPPSGFGEVVS